MSNQLDCQLIKTQSRFLQPMWLVGESLLLAITIAIPLSVQAGLLDRVFNIESTEANDIAVSVSDPGPLDVVLLSAINNPDPVGARGGSEIVINEGALVSTGPVGKDEMAKENHNLGEIRVHTVRVGETLSEIAEMFGVTANTILWANDLRRSTDIRPGDTLVILPIVGVSHVVKKGDTISSIAKKYDGDADEILQYNQLASADEVKTGDTLIIPGGAMHDTVAKTSTKSQPSKVTGAGSASSKLSHPAPGSVKTQGIHGYNAVDLAAGYGTPIRASASGEVIVSKSSGWNGGYGQYIVVRHPNGTQTLYAHLMRNDVGVGAYVSQGQVIGGMGNTGRSTGNHLHFEVRGGANPF